MSRHAAARPPRSAWLELWLFVMLVAYIMGTAAAWLRAEARFILIMAVFLALAGLTIAAGVMLAYQLTGAR